MDAFFAAFAKGIASCPAENLILNQVLTSGAPRDRRTQQLIAAAEQLRMPVEPCVLGCSHLRMIRDR